MWNKWSYYQIMGYQKISRLSRRKTRPKISDRSRIHITRIIEQFNLCQLFRWKRLWIWTQPNSGTWCHFDFPTKNVLNFFFENFHQIAEISKKKNSIAKVNFIWKTSPRRAFTGHACERRWLRMFLNFVSASALDALKLKELKLGLNSQP